MSDNAVSDPIVVDIEPHRRVDFGLLELWQHRSLVYHLGWRDVRVRYRRALLGATWAFLQPLLTVAVLTAALSKVVKPTLKIDQPYWLFALCGLIGWNFQAASISQASAALLSHANMIRKVYFPRLAIPLAALSVPLLDLIICTAMVVVLCLCRGLGPRSTWVLLPLFIAHAALTGAATAIWLSAICARFRDVRFVLPLLVNLLLFATPVIYPIELAEASLAARGLPGWLLGLNAVVGHVTSIRWALIGGEAHWATWLASGATTCALLASGILFFRSTERSLPDLL